jgi:hypothetical protein
MEPPPDEDRDEEEPELLDGALEEREGALKERDGALYDLEGALNEGEDERKDGEGALYDLGDTRREDEDARYDGAVVLLDLGTLLKEDPERFTLRIVELERGETFDLIVGVVRFLEGDAVVFERNSRRFDDRDGKLPLLAGAADFRIWEGAPTLDISPAREALF